MRIIVTRPQHDVTTKYLSAWAEEIIIFAREKGAEVYDLQKEKANQMELGGRIKKVNPDFVFLNGHGGDGFVSGHDNCIIVSADVNCELLARRTTYALSCNSGKVLGRKVAQANNTAYIGYSDEFIFVADRNYLTDPLSDPNARPFKDASNQVMISLLKGHGAQEASARSKNKFRELYQKLSSSNAGPESRQIAQCLWW
ncbi:MAG: hypothetical protein V1763_00205, partial [Parcubacteria group bacterium]